MQGCYWWTFLDNSSSHNILFGTTVSKICKMLTRPGSEVCDYKEVGQLAQTELKPDSSANQRSQLSLRCSGPEWAGGINFSLVSVT